MSLQLLQDAARKNKLIPFSRMHPSIAMLPTQEQAALAFAEVEAAIRLLYQRGGQAALTELVSAMASGFSDQQAVAQAYGKTFQEFEADWRAEVARPRSKATSQKNVRPMVARKLVFKEDAKGKTEPGELQTVSPHEAEGDAESKKAVRLGEILFARRRWGAAAHEYAKARARLEKEVPLVARRYAFAEVQLGHWFEAEEALRSAVERDPDDETAQALYAHVLVKQRKLDKARNALEQGIAVDPFDPDLHATYVEVARGLEDKALEEREKKAYALSTGAGVKDR
jgi:tetratricopeptide (TPR) repeat protein